MVSCTSQPGPTDIQSLFESGILIYEKQEDQGRNVTLARSVENTTSSCADEMKLNSSNRSQADEEVWI